MARKGLTYTRQISNVQSCFKLRTIFYTIFLLKKYRKWVSFFELFSTNTWTYFKNCSVLSLIFHSQLNAPFYSYHCLESRMLTISAKCLTYPLRFLPQWRTPACRSPPCRWAAGWSPSFPASPPAARVGNKKSTKKTPNKTHKKPNKNVFFF